MKGAGYFSLFPKDLQRHMFKSVFDETTRVMLVCATQRDKFTLGYLKGKLTVRCPINWFEWAMSHGYDALVEMAEAFGVAFVSPDYLFNALAWGPVTKYLPRFMYHHITDIFQRCVAVGHPENWAWVIRWIEASKNDFRILCSTNFQLFEHMLRGILKYSVDETKAVGKILRVFLETKNRHVRISCIVDIKCVMDCPFIRVWDTMIKCGFLKLAGEMIPEKLLKEQDKTHIEALLQRGAVWHENHFQFAAECSIEFLQWALQKGCPHPANALEILAKKRDFSYAEWWMKEYREEIPLNLLFDEISNENFSPLPWLAKHAPDDFCIRIVKLLIAKTRFDQLTHFASRNLFQDVEDLLPVLSPFGSLKHNVENLKSLIRIFKLPHVSNSSLMEMSRGMKRQKK